MTAFVNVIRKRSGLANAASAPRQTAAATTTAAAATASATATAPAASAAAASAAAAARFLYQAAPSGCQVLLVEEIERRQTDVGDFLFTESDRMSRYKVRRRREVRRRYSRGGCAPHHR